MTVRASANMYAGAQIELVGERWRDSVAIVFCDADMADVRIDFYDPGMLDRLAELATRGAGLLRAKLAELVDTDGDPADVDDDRPVEPAAP